MSKITLISISGDDRPGLTSSLARILAGRNVRILDIGQAVVHDALALGMLIEVPDGHDFTPLKKDLIARAHELDLKIKFSAVSAEAFDQWVRAQGKFRFIVTVLGREITAEQFASITEMVSLHNFNIDVIERLSGRLSLSGRHQVNACVELQISGVSDSSPGLRAELLEIAQRFDIDIAFQRESIYRRNRRLFVFDMDSTLIDGEVIDELAKLHGVGEKV